jgi:lipopolysaccharide transport system ATP-binding protein
MAQMAINTHALGKRYTIGVHGRSARTLREAIMRSARSGPRRGQGRTATAPDNKLWALRNLNLTITQGEVVGLIGHNGAGKSTLLKILSRITEPSAGWADVSGRVGSLLEVGTGFHPELTGRENIFLNGAILGMRRAEIRRRFDEIVAFSEIEQFLDTPVKRYSSGMTVRLAFAVASHLEPEILLVDEVLAVGDAAFQRKSLGKMGEVASQGRTVIFVSHNLAIIQALCPRVVLLQRGEVVADGPVMETVTRYLRGLESGASGDLLERADRDRRGWNETLVRAVEVTRADASGPGAIVAGSPVRITVHITEVLALMECRLTIANSLGQPVTTLDSQISAPSDTRDVALGPRFECQVGSLSLVPGRYRIDVVLRARRQIQDGLEAAAFFDVEPGVIDGRPLSSEGIEGNVILTHAWRIPA